MTKQEHIDYWVTSAKRDWKTVQNLLKTKEYVPSLFFAHLHLEKLCKAIWVKNSDDNHPPKIHNLVKILKEAGLHFSDNYLDFMIIMNNFQLEGRYPDYKQLLYKTYKKANTEIILKQAKEFSKWLQGQL